MTAVMTSDDPGGTIGGVRVPTVEGMEKNTAHARSEPVDPSASASATGSLPRPRLPVGVRVLLPLLLLLPAAAASALPASLPGVAAALNRPDALGAAAYALVSATSLLAFVLFAVLLVRLVDRRPLATLGLRPGARAAGALLLGVLVSVLAMAAAAAVGGLTGIARTFPEGDLEQAAGAGVPLAVILSIVLLRAFVLQGIGEELLFRGYLLQTLSHRPVTAVLVSAVAFAIPHLASGAGSRASGRGCSTSRCRSASP